MIKFGFDALVIELDFGQGRIGLTKSKSRNAILFAQLPTAVKVGELTPPIKIQPEMPRLCFNFTNKESLDVLIQNLQGLRNDWKETKEVEK